MATSQFAGQKRPTEEVQYFSIPCSRPSSLISGHNFYQKIEIKKENRGQKTWVINFLELLFFYVFKLNFKDSTTEAKKDKTDNITERIRQLEEKYEKLQNSSRKLAESVVSGEFSKDEAKSLLTKMEE